MPLPFLTAIQTALQIGLEPVALYALYRMGLLLGYYKSRPQPRISPARIIPLFTLPRREALRQVLGEEGMAALLTEADEVVAGTFRMFGGEPAPIRLAGDWLLAHWTLYETGKVQLEGDIKFVWEPARFGWAFTLGRAYHLTQEERYAEAFWKYFETFAEANPPYLGPHWMNGQEVALRLLALIWAARVFEAASASRPARQQRLIESIAIHAQRIPPTLVYARAQNNNHLVTEAAALYAAGRMLNHRRWQSTGWRWLNWSFKNQISPYGEYIQHSTNYHRLMLQAALYVNAIKDRDWPRITFRALARASHWLFSIVDPVSGRAPNLGANDGALILPLSATPFSDFRPTVQAAARAFLKMQMPSGIWDEMSLWLGLDSASKIYGPQHYVGDNLRGPNSWAFLRASTFKSRLSHMDQLHLDLWWRGLNVAQDAGTYSYNAEPPWDNPLTVTRVHNTVIVDGRDQMHRVGRFLTLNWVNAYARVEVTAEENVLQKMAACHEGYRGVRHERTVMVYADERWRVTDTLTARRVEPHTYRLHWLLPDWKWEIEEGKPGARLRLQSPYGWVELHVACFAAPSASPSLSQAPGSHDRPEHGEMTLVRAGERIYGRGQALAFEGWVSPTYGVKQPALSFSLEARSTRGIVFVTDFLFPASIPVTLVEQR